MGEELEETIEKIKQMGGFVLVLSSYFREGEDQERKYQLYLSLNDKRILKFSLENTLSKEEYLSLMGQIDSADRFLKLACYYKRREEFDA